MRVRLAAVLAGAVIATPAWAHHSFAMFDATKEAQIEGVVRAFQWTNPHIWLEVEVQQNAKPVVFSIEGSSPSGLRRRGWTRESFKPGDKVTVVMHPLKSGEPGGAFIRAITPNGPIADR